VSLRDRIDTLSRGELTGLIVVVVVALAGTGLWYTRSLPKPVQISAPVAQLPDAGSASQPASSVASPVVGSPTASGSPVIVDVTGWVRHPGVYEFSPGDRVIDAVRKAGGARPGADLSAINLAAPLVDGSQVVVPKAGEAGGIGTSGPSGTSTGGTSAGGQLNINTATEQQLEGLNGIGPVLASAIVQYRTQHGLFRSVDDLLGVSGIGPVTLEELRPQVTV
jgi:competence protein ComEA